MNTFTFIPELYHLLLQLYWVVACMQWKYIIYYINCIHFSCVEFCVVWSNEGWIHCRENATGFPVCVRSGSSPQICHSKQQSGSISVQPTVQGLSHSPCQYQYIPQYKVCLTHLLQSWGHVHCSLHYIFHNENYVICEVLVFKGF